MTRSSVGSISVACIWSFVITPSTPDGATARSGPWPPLQYASRYLGSLLYLSIRLSPSFSGPWTCHPAISFLVFLFVLLHTAFRTACFFGIAMSCILSICPSHLILSHLINLTMFSLLIMTSTFVITSSWTNCCLVSPSIKAVFCRTSKLHFCLRRPRTRLKIQVPIADITFVVIVHFSILLVIQVSSQNSDLFLIFFTHYCIIPFRVPIVRECALPAAHIWLDCICCCSLCVPTGAVKVLSFGGHTTVCILWA